MKRNLTATIAAVTLFAALALPVRLAAQGRTRYKLIDIGTLGGPNSSLPGSFFEGIAAKSLSRAGTLAGQADTATPDPFAPNCFGDCFVSHAIQWRDGVFTDLGALDSSETLSSASSWISINGLIAGLSQNGEIDPLNPDLPSEVRAVLWKHGKITDLGTLEGGTESIALAVNARGQVVGLATNTIPDAYSIVGVTTETRAFLWQNGAMQDLGTLGGPDAVASLINERGQIAGLSYTDSLIPPPTPFCGDFPLIVHGFLWENGAMKDIGTLGGHCTTIYALNNRGQVVGQSTVAEDQTSHPYIWDREGMTDLGTLGGTYGYAQWINDAGTVVGTVTNANDQALLAALWKDGVISNLGTLPGNACSATDAINSAGQVVGGSGFNAAQFFPACTDLVEHAFLWENGTMVDLNAFVPPGSNLTLNEAVFINDRGEISGSGTLPNGDQHVFVMIPCGGNGTACEDAARGTSATTGFSSAPPRKRRPSENNPIRRVPRQRRTFKPRGTQAGTWSLIDSIGVSPQSPSLQRTSGTGTGLRCTKAGYQCWSGVPPCCRGLQCVALGNRHYCEPY
jgi:probable HAF family extracellular repeat protein